MSCCPIWAGRAVGGYHGPGGLGFFNAIQLTTELGSGTAGVRAPLRRVDVGRITAGAVRLHPWVERFTVDPMSYVTSARSTMHPNPSTNPDPATTTGLEPGTGVPVGDTPPAEASATVEYATRQSPPPVGKSSWFIGFAVFMLFLLLIVVGMMGRALSLF